jgi:hypothetical protein
MKKQDVPQQPSPDIELTALGYYVTNDRGGFDIIPSQGWEAINDAYGEQVQFLTEVLARARQKVEAGEASTLYYHMEARQFSPKLLAQYLGMWTFQVKRHFKPQVFARLPRGALERYASFFRITVDELRALPDPSVKFRLLRGSTVKY